jgi:hypothetical protein
MVLINSPVYSTGMYVIFKYILIVSTAPEVTLRCG